MSRVASRGIFNYSYRVPSNELFEGFLRPDGCTLQGIQPLSKTVLSTITSLGLGLGLDACFDQGRDGLGVRSRGIFEHIDPPTKVPFQRARSKVKLRRVPLKGPPEYCLGWLQQNVVDSRGPETPKAPSACTMQRERPQPNPAV